MKKLFLVLTALGLVLCSAYADYVVLETELEPYAKSADVPTDMSDLNDDVGYATTEDVPTNVGELTNDVGYITSGDVPTVVSAFSNDAGYVTASDIPAQVQSDWSETNSASPAYIDNKPALITSNEVSEIARNIAQEVVDEMTSVGWEVDGTWYKLVVQSFVPPSPPLAETTFVVDGTNQTYDIVGELGQQWMIEHGWVDGYDGSWLVTVTSANIGTNVTEVGDSVFFYCGDLTSVTIPDSVTDIWDEAFEGCTNLTSVAIGDGVTNIWGQAFRGCSALTSVTIPGSVTAIGDDSFFGCSALVSVDMSGKAAATVQGMPDYPWGLSSGCVITCSDGTITIP